MSALAALRVLDRHEKRALIRASLALAVVRVLLKLFKMRTVIALLDRAGVARFRRNHLAAERIVYLVHAAANRRALAANCVPRAVTSYFLLRRSGFSAQIRFGVDKERLSSEGSFGDHAWVEIENVPIGEPADLLDHFDRFTGQGSAT